LHFGGEFSDVHIKLLEEIIESYFIGVHARERVKAESRKGIPIGNLTSQLFANVYLNELDYFIKNQLKVKYYLRYTDDFVIINENKKYLLTLIPQIEMFLREEFSLKLHPKKVSIRKFHQGIDFLGYILFPHHRLLRTKLKKRMQRKLKKRVKGYQRGQITKHALKTSLNSYLGVLSHANTFNLSRELKNQLCFYMAE